MLQGVGNSGPVWLVWCLVMSFNLVAHQATGMLAEKADYKLPSRNLVLPVQ